MKVFALYLRSKVKYLSVVVVFVAIFSAIFFANNIDVSLISYGLLLFACFLCIFVAVDFFKFRKKHIILHEMLKNVDAGNLDFPESFSAIECDYMEIVKTLYNKKMSVISGFEVSRKEMDDYFSMWLHQIKTPISAMSLMLGGEEINRSELKVELFRIEQYAQMALTYLRLENINADMSFELCDIDALVRRCVKKYARVFILKKINVEVSHIDIRAVTDPKWFAFVVEQILSNSLKYTKTAGTIKIYGNGKKLIISDDGIGIHQEDLPRVFEKGFTGYNGRTGAKSTGLGLYLCKKTLTALSHEIKIASDNGTQVTINLENSSVNVND